MVYGVILTPLFIVVLCSMGFSKLHDKISVGLLLGDRTPNHSEAVQYILAAQWAAEVINNQSTMQQIEIEVFDIYGQTDLTRDMFLAIKSALEPRDKLPLLGLIGFGDPEVLEDTISSLHVFNIPIILATPRLADTIIQRGNILTTAPDMSGVVMPVLAVAKKLAVNKISLISHCTHIIQKFQHAAKEMGIENGHLLNLTKHSTASGDDVKQFLKTLKGNETIALILEPDAIHAIAENLRGYNMYNTMLITGTIGLDKNSLKLWKNIFLGGYLVEPHMPELPDFRNYFISKLHFAGTHNVNDSVLQNYVEEIYQCKWKHNMVTESHAEACETLTEKQLTSKLRIIPEVTFVVKAVSAFSAAMFLVQAEHCQGHNLMQCQLLFSNNNNNNNLHQEILQRLAQLRITSQLQGTSLHVTHDGQLISNKYVIYNIRDTGDVTGVGWYSDEQGLVLDYGVGHIPHDRHRILPEDKQVRGFVAEMTVKRNRIEKITQDLSEPGMGVDIRRVTPESSFTRPWATLMAAVAAIGTCITTFMLVYVLIKICDGTLAGNQSLGVILLLGIMTLYASIILFLLPVSEICCLLRAFLYPIVLCLCYGILIIKAMQLRSLVLLGPGGRISYFNQYVILFFIVLVQVVISVQWFIANKPHHRQDTCYMPRTDFLLLHLYIAILVLIAFLYGLTVFKIRRNYKEGQWLTLAAFITMPVLAIWGSARSLVSEKYDDPSACMALTVLASVLVLAFFVPKMSTVSKQNRHFKDKKIPLANSVTTVFTDLRISRFPGTREKNMRPQPFSDNVTKNHMYTDFL